MLLTLLSGSSMLPSTELRALKMSAVQSGQNRASVEMLTMFILHGAYEKAEHNFYQYLCFSPNQSMYFHA